MKRSVLKKILLLSLIFMMSIQVGATNMNFKDDREISITELNNIRKQFMAILKSGDFKKWLF